jgi:hypothetical protein
MRAGREDAIKLLTRGQVRHQLVSSQNDMSVSFRVLFISSFSYPVSYFLRVTLILTHAVQRLPHSTVARHLTFPAVESYPHVVNPELRQTKDHQVDNAAVLHPYLDAKI